MFVLRDEVQDFQVFVSVRANAVLAAVWSSTMARSRTSLLAWNFHLVAGCVSVATYSFESFTDRSNLYPCCFMSRAIMPVLRVNPGDFRRPGSDVGALRLGAHLVGLDDRIAGGVRADGRLALGAGLGPVGGGNESTETNGRSNRERDDRLHVRSTVGGRGFTPSSGVGLRIRMSPEVLVPGSYWSNSIVGLEDAVRLIDLNHNGVPSTSVRMTHLCGGSIGVLYACG